MIKAIIIDDEKNARFLLRDLLKRNCAQTLNLVGEADDVNTGIKAIQKYGPDVVFLDIQMKNGTGFDLLKQVKNVDFEVIFITAYDNYAIKAFEFSAFGYLLKPIKSGDLRNLVDRLATHLEKLKVAADKRVKILIDNYGDEAGKMKRLVINNIEGFQVVDIDHIIRLEASSNYTQFILSEGKSILVSRTLGQYEDLLKENGFFRIHQSHIVNLRHVQGYLKVDGGRVKMSDGSELSLSRNRKAAFIDRFV